MAGKTRSLLSNRANRANFWCPDIFTDNWAIFGVYGIWQRTSSVVQLKETELIILSQSELVPVMHTTVTTN
jgi:hypothetical protein